MKKIISLLLVIQLLAIGSLTVFASLKVNDTEISRWPFKQNACLMVMDVQSFLGREKVYDYNDVVMPNGTAEVEPDDFILFRLNNYVETEYGLGIDNDVSEAEIVVTNAGKQLYETQYPRDSLQGVTLNGGSQVRSMPSMLEYIIVPANLLYGECEAVFSVTRKDQRTEIYKFNINVKQRYLPLTISKIDVRETNNSNGDKLGYIFLEDIEGLIGFASPDMIDKLSISSMGGKECYVTGDVNMQRLFDKKIDHDKHESIGIPFRYDGLNYRYKLTIPKGVLQLKSGLNEEYILDFDVEISVSDYILNFSPESGSVVMMDTKTQTEPLTIDVAKPCQIAEDMKIFVNGNTVDYEMSDEKDYYRINFDLAIEDGQHYAVSFEDYTIVLPNGATNEKTIGFGFDTVLKNTVDILHASAFRDLPQEHWAHTFISSLTEKRIISGYEDGTFKPESYVTRGELAKLLAVAFEKTTVLSSGFADVGNHWAAEYIAAIQQVIPLRDDLKIINFYPDEYATREEVAASIALLVDVSRDEIVDPAINVTTFLDESEIREDLHANVNLAVYLGIIYGYDGNVFKPHGNINRAEIAAMIYRALKL